MATSFDHWSDRIGAANEPAARRALLAEVATWRARNLVDILAMREATYAVSRLHALLGDHEAAVREARSLVSLCHTSPAASAEQYAAAMAHLRGLGEPVPKMPAPRPERPSPRANRPEARERRERPGRAAQPSAGAPAREDASSRDQALELARAGDPSGAIAALQGRRGAPVDLLRAALQLARALSSTGDARDADLRDLDGWLRRRVGLEGRPARAEESEEAGPVPDDPLSRLLGRAAPRRRERRIEVIEAWAVAHPGRVDEIADAALRHHVEVSGLASPAPWLASVVGMALARGGARTAATVEELRAKGAFAVTAYAEEPARRLVALLGAALAAGWRFGGLRRGVMARGEPGERKLWTLRLERDGTERMVAVAPAADTPYAEGLSARIAQRLTRLCARTVLLAPGVGNGGLREAAGALGIRAFADAPADGVVLEALQGARAVEPSGEDEDRAERASPAVEAPREEEDRTPTPDADLVSALAASDVSVEALLPVVQRFRRRFRAIVTAERALGDAPDDHKVAAFLTAVHDAADPDEALPEGTTLAVRAAAGGGARAAGLLTGGPTAGRYGGPGIDAVVAIARALTEDGWRVHRVLRGATRREQRDHPVLDTLGEHLGGLWRLLVRRGAARGEIWYVAELPIEGRAAVPQLLLDARQRAVLLPIEPDLLTWYATLRGPEAIGWTGDEGDALRAEVARWGADEPG